MFFHAEAEERNASRFRGSQTRSSNGLHRSIRSRTSGWPSNGAFGSSLQQQRETVHLHVFDGLTFKRDRENLRRVYSIRWRRVTDMPVGKLRNILEGVRGGHARQVNV